MKNRLLAVSTTGDWYLGILVFLDAKTVIVRSLLNRPESDLDLELQLALGQFTTQKDRENYLLNNKIS